MKIAVEGCAHGELEKIYDVIAHLEEENKIKVDLVLICGDFQSVRNETDLECMAVPVQYRHMQSFYKYYSGEKVAPILTIFVGGNHEASNYLSELNYGGWVCPNIYYLGKAGVVQVGGLRIAGLSGIFNGNSYLKGAYEIPPYDKSSLRTVYHVRNLDVFRLGLLSQPIDIMLSHDWPRGIYNHGDYKQLLRFKPYFKDEIDRGQLGSPPAEMLLNKLKPKHWFSAHLHCKFVALVNHEEGQSTKFLALDKCLPRRRFLQILDIESTGQAPYKLHYDLEWLSILRETDSLLNFTKNYTVLPDITDPSYLESFKKELSTKCNEILELLNNSDIVKSIEGEDNGMVPIPTDFKVTIAPYTGQKTKKYNIPPPILSLNNQTTSLCEVLGITDPAQVLIGMSQNDSSLLTASSVSGVDDMGEYEEGSSKNPDEIDLESDESAKEENETCSTNISNETKETADLDSDNDLSAEGDFKLFVIDRKPSSSTPYKRLSMILPTPVNSADETSHNVTDELHSSVSDSRELLSKRVCTDERIAVSSSSCEQNTPVEKRTMKRRNQALYAAKNSDESS